MPPTYHNIAEMDSQVTGTGAQLDEAMLDATTSSTQPENEGQADTTNQLATTLLGDDDAVIVGGPSELRGAGLLPASAASEPAPAPPAPPALAPTAPVASGFAPANSLPSKPVTAANPPAYAELPDGTGRQPVRVWRFEDRVRVPAREAAKAAEIRTYPSERDTVHATVEAGRARVYKSMSAALKLLQAPQWGQWDEDSREWRWHNAGKSWLSI